MSSGSGEVDVIRTRIPAYADDNIVLYAYEPNTAYFSNETAASDTSYNEEQGTVQDILIHCQAIYDAIQHLDKKFDVIHGKVSKIHRYRCCMRSTWQSRKLHGHRYKNYKYQHSRKRKGLKRKRRELTSSLSLTESPTIPVSRQDNDSQSNTLGIPLESQKSPEQEQESFSQEQEPCSQEQEPCSQEQEPCSQEQEPCSQEQEPCSQEQEPFSQEQETERSESPGIPAIFTQPCEPYEYTQEESMQVPCYYDSPPAHSTTDFFPPNQAAVIPTATILTQMEPEPIPDPHVVTYPPLFDSQPSRHNSSPPCTPNTYAPTSPVRNRPDFFRENFPEDPSTWSVDEVITFLQDVDPLTLDPLVDLFREHGIDGKALLLLKSDMMIKYMGLKVGTALKVCHYVEGLKEGRYIYNL